MYIKKLIEFGRMNYDEINGNDLSGDRSWEHCHKVFKKYHDEVKSGKELSAEDKDFLCLHLAWYLASWGMLRNSFLRLYSYQIHEKAVIEIFDSKWDDLWDVDFTKVQKDNYAKNVMELSGKLNEIYKKRDRVSADTQKDDKDITDTLQTKILLGTVGCVPAYDTYLKNALKNNTEIKSNTYNEKSLSELIRFYNTHKDDFEEFKADCKNERIDYPSAKIVDMCFFQYGFLSSKAEKLADRCLKEKDFEYNPKNEKYKMKRGLCLAAIHGFDAVKETYPDISISEEDVDSIVNELKKDDKYSKYFKCLTD